MSADLDLGNTYFIPYGNNEDSIGANAGILLHMLPDGRCHALVIDCGAYIDGATPERFQTMIPDLRWLLQDENVTVDFLLTHAHADHNVGFGHYALNAKEWGWDHDNHVIACTQETADLSEKHFSKMGLRKSKLPQFEIFDVSKLDPHTRHYPTKAYGDFDGEPIFTVEAIPVPHSIPGSVAFYIKTPTIKFFYSGDMNGDPRDFPFDRFFMLGQEGIDFMALESTYQGFLKDKMTTEQQVRLGMRKEVSRFDDKALIFPGLGGNFNRQLSVIYANILNGRTSLMINGAAIWDMFKIARKNHVEIGNNEKMANLLRHEIRVLLAEDDIEETPEISENIEKLTVTNLNAQQSEELFRKENLNENGDIVIKDDLAIPHKDVFVLVTGAWGGIGRFPKMAMNENCHVIALQPPIPGKNETYQKNMVNHTKNLGVTIITPHDANDTIHKSGHIHSVEEWERVVSTANPDYIIPIHSSKAQYKAHLALIRAYKEKIKSKRSKKHHFQKPLGTGCIALLEKVKDKNGKIKPKAKFFGTLKAKPFIGIQRDTYKKPNSRQEFTTAYYYSYNVDENSTKNTYPVNYRKYMMTPKDDTDPEDTPLTTHKFIRFNIAEDIQDFPDRT